MKKLMLASAFAVIVISNLYAQPSKFYGSSGAEIIFSYANIDDNGNDQGSIVRFSPLLNVQGFANYDPSNVVGFFTGLGIRNVGFIYEPPESHYMMKYRTYNLGIPVGFKVGKLDYMFLFAGYEVEFPFVYKEKKFENETKDVSVEWFSDRVVPVQHSLMAGVQFPYGLDLKIKFYLSNFHNKDYVQYVGGIPTMPYKDLNSNIFYVSLGWRLFTNFKVYKHKDYYDYSLTWDEEPLVVTNRPRKTADKNP